MEAQVTAALVSGGAALTVAVLGIAGAIVAQLFTARHAFENSLALQERQYAKQEKKRQEQSRREDAYRFADQRRSTYSRFVRLAREYLHAVETERAVTKNLEGISRQRDQSARGSPDLEMTARAVERLVADAQERTRRLHGEFGTACEEIYLLGSQKVRQATDQLWDEAHKAMHSSDSSYTAARVEFLEAARQELGIMRSQQSWIVPEEPPAGHQS